MGTSVQTVLRQACVLVETPDAHDAACACVCVCVNVQSCCISMTLKCSDTLAQITDIHLFLSQSSAILFPSSHTCHTVTCKDKSAS